VTSWKWWFENRQTGRITIGQFPNWPLWCIAGCWLAQRVVDDGSTADDALTVATHGLWLYWGADELIRGVNPWRRLLGTGVLAWQVGSILF